ncbi:MAG: hypothetical protein CVT49_14495 [candidate division Zixibacteria bacterium HGW-Zixibacteria-1]|nr:MAG: hypothetical protein CVT49_14495 [candidate division Zixibacteria bacterium HGW-Zixibacteria-1]
MKKCDFNKYSKLFVLPICLVVFLLAGCAGDKPIGEVTKFTLDNGMQVILKENHASAMATSLIFVKAGSKYEDKYINGTTHFLEHLLFNGTATHSQEEIEHGIERLGGYINAFTRKEFTAYLVSMPRDYIDYGMATQSDMLFNSIFPKESMAKERGIVIEEIKMGDDAEGAPAEAFFEEKGMAATPYSQPVIGYESTIANIPREAIIDYYKHFYAPNNMIALIMGDFDTEQMTKMVKSIFGQFPKVELPAPPELTAKPIIGKQVYKTPARVKSTYIKYTIEAPSFTDPDYFAFALLESYLGDRENSPLVKALNSGSDPLVTNVSAALDTKEELTRLNIEIITERADMADSIMVLTDKVIEYLVDNLPSPELLEGYKVTGRCNDIYMSEKLHYYGFTIAPLMAITGWDFFSKYRDMIDSVTVDNIATACCDYLVKPNYIATVVFPGDEETEQLYESAGPDNAEVAAYFGNKEYPDYDLNTGKDFRMPDARPITDSGKRHADYIREVLDNGLTVVVKSNPDSRVFALNVIGKNRSATELPGKDGITDFVNRMIEKGTTTRPAMQLSNALSSIGANVTLYDNPWIPYDDRYTTRQFSFMKFETIDLFADRGLDIFSDMIMNPAFDSVEVEQVRSEIMGLLGRDSGSTYKTARNKFYAALFEGAPYAKTIEGNFRTIGLMTTEDLRQHHSRIYSPENTIITVGTNYAADKMMSMLRKKFGAMKRGGFEPIDAARPAEITGEKSINQQMDKEQVYIYIGHLLPAAGSPDAPGLSVANAVLSNRLQKKLREEKGWAYSVGSSVMLDKNFGWMICSMGTQVKNFNEAKAGIMAEIERLKTEPPTEDELEQAVNSIWGSSLMARLSRINQAYYMGVNEYLGLGYDYDDTYIDKIRSVTAAHVSELAGKYFNTKNYVIATAGNI